MTTPDQTPAPTTPAGAEQVAQVAHGFFQRVAALAEEAKAEILKFIPGSVVQDLTEEGEQVAEKTI